MTVRSFLAYSLLIFLLLPSTPLAAKGVENDEEKTRWVDSVLNTLDMRERVGQLFMVACYPTLGEKHMEKIKRHVKEDRIGGILFSVAHPTQVVELCNQLQVASDVPLIMAIDGEWGPSMRIDSTLSFPRQMTLGAIDDPQLIYDMGVEIAKQCKALGFHINFAPVVDINSDPNNPVINTRSFGEDKKEVTERSLAYMHGMQDNGIMASAKHFPGHGDTDVDSHKALPVLMHTREQIDTLELYPFKQLIAEGVGSIMVGHLNVPALDTASNTPASLSKKIITDLLRNELGYNGLIITDALNMKGITSTCKTKEEVPLRALMAGCDMLLQPEEVTRSIDTIIHAIDSGLISIEIINQHCRRVVEAKFDAGLYNDELTKTEGLLDKLNAPEAKMLSYKLVENALTLVHNKDNILPLQRLDTLKIACLSVGNDAEFSSRMACYTDIARFSMPKTPNKQNLAKLEKDLAPYNFIIVGYHEADSRPQKNFGIDSQKLAFIEKLTKSKKVVFNFFGTPYAIGKLRNPDAFAAIVVSNNNFAATQDRSAQAIFGGVPFKGKLPVSIGTKYAIGYGIDVKEAVRLKYAFPEELGISSEQLSKADSMVNAAIRQGAMPGCQVLVAHKGQVFYSKSFGNFTYGEKSTDVSRNTIYDLASVTKVTATLPAVMKLVDEGKLFLDSSLGSYLPSLQKTNKSDLVVRDVLTHQSGLQAWILYYKHYLLPKQKGAEIFSSSKSSSYPTQLLNQPIYVSKNYYLDTTSFSPKKSKRFSVAVSDKMFATAEVPDYVRTTTDSSPLDEKVYRYSDMGFMYLQRLVEIQSGTPLDRYVDQSFYRELGMTRTLFNPLSRFKQSQITPSEKEDVFLKQVIQGTVHDPAAAMLGGVSGHAGLFSTANDLAKLCQLYLNRGSYGGKQYIKPEVVDEFTCYQFRESGNRRALGFDKPEPGTKSNVCPEVSDSSYGHSGFTGTFIWIDPENELVFIFLSNRTYPTWDNSKLSKLNLRTDLLGLFINAIKSRREKLFSGEHVEVLGKIQQEYKQTFKL